MKKFLIFKKNFEKGNILNNNYNSINNINIYNIFI